MAPVTGQGAALEKEGGPDPGTVMDTVPLDLKNIGIFTHSAFLLQLLPHQIIVATYF
jgi:hypothetical protein